MTMCPFCDTVYDESENPYCPTCYKEHADYYTITETDEDNDD